MTEKFKVGDTVYFNERGFTDYLDRITGSERRRYGEPPFLNRKIEKGTPWQLQFLLTKGCPLIVVFIGTRSVRVICPSEENFGAFQGESFEGKPVNTWSIEKDYLDLGKQNAISLYELNKGL